MIDRECIFCEPDNFEVRQILIGKHVYSIVSNPAFRSGHCLVIPRRHIEQVGDLDPSEATELMGEVGRLAKELATDFGSAVLQKSQPRINDGPIKHSHLHFHVIPRIAADDEDNLFGVPRTFAEMHTISQDEINNTLETTRP